MYDFLTSLELYRFLKGPMVWVAFTIFIVGSLYRVTTLLQRAKKAKVIYPYMSLRYGLRSISHWLIPFASTNMREHPWITIVSFLFHICLILTPIFLFAHNMLVRESWNIRWWTLPDGIADLMTLTVISCSLFFLLRRLISPEVRFVTFASDYIVLFIATAPFITGFMAFHQLFFDYELIVTIHILLGEIMLIAIPFTKLSHMLFFWLTRAYMGSEFGSVRHSKDY
jgi:nitrate reductase gamma subunit